MAEHRARAAAENIAFVMMKRLSKGCALPTGEMTTMTTEAEDREREASDRAYVFWLIVVPLSALLVGSVGALAIVLLGK